jgi:hypothetical protein
VIRANNRYGWNSPRWNWSSIKKKSLAHEKLTIALKCMCTGFVTIKGFSSMTNIMTVLCWSMPCFHHSCSYFDIKI